MVDCFQLCAPRMFVRAKVKLVLLGSSSMPPAGVHWRGRQQPAAAAAAEAVQHGPLQGQRSPMFPSGTPQGTDDVLYSGLAKVHIHKDKSFHHKKPSADVWASSSSVKKQGERLDSDPFAASMLSRWFLLGLLWFITRWLLQPRVLTLTPHLLQVTSSATGASLLASACRSWSTRGCTASF